MPGKLINGYYISNVNRRFYYIVQNTTLTGFPWIYLDFPDKFFESKAVITYDDFGPAKKEFQEESKINNYNVKISVSGGNKGPEIKDRFGIISENGKSMYLRGDWNNVEIQQWVSEEEFDKFNMARESFDAPSCPHYEIQPIRQGKLFWLSGKY